MLLSRHSRYNPHPHPIHFTVGTGFAANRSHLQLSPEARPWVMGCASPRGSMEPMTDWLPWVCELVGGGGHKSSTTLLPKGRQTVQTFMWHQAEARCHLKSCLLSFSLPYPNFLTSFEAPPKSTLSINHLHKNHVSGSASKGARPKTVNKWCSKMFLNAMFLNAISCSKCGLFVHQSLNKHIRILSRCFQTANLDINTTFLGTA